MAASRDVVRGSGQALPLVLLVVAVVASIAVATARVGGVIELRQRAQAAADAAALAATTGGCEAATRLAGRNGAEVVWCRTQGRDAEVRVAIGGIGATARAGVGRVP